MYKKLIVALVLLAAIILPASAGSLPPFTPDSGVNQGYLGCDETDPAAYVYRDESITWPAGAEPWTLNGGYCTNATNTFTSTSTLFGPADTAAGSQAFFYNNPGAGKTMAFHAITNNLGGDRFRTWLVYNEDAPPVINVTFSISDVTSFTAKLSGVNVTLSNGQMGTTATNGSVTIGVTPNSSAYNYALSKSGYYSEFGALGGYGETGGTVYLTMEQADSSGSKVVNILATDAVSGNYIDGFTANVLDTVTGSWINGTYPTGIGEILTNQTTPLQGYLSATGYLPATSTWTAYANDYEDNWVVPMYKPGDIIPPGGADVGISTLRIFVTHDDSSTPFSNVNVLNTISGQYKLTPGSGVVIFNVTNNSVVSVVASKSGYHTTTKSFTISTALVDGTMSLLEQTVSLTPTLAPGETVPVTPTLTGSALAQHNQAQASGAMQILYDNAASIISLCVVVLILKLMQMI